MGEPLHRLSVDRWWITFCVAALGHALGVFFLIAIPTLLLSAGVALVAAAAAISNRIRGARSVLRNSPP